MPDHRNKAPGIKPAATAGIAAQHWQLLVDAACNDGQVASAQVLRIEGMLQLALEQGAVDAALLLQWGVQAARRLATAIPNPLWPASVIQVDDGVVRIVILHQRAPVHRSTRE